MNASKTEKIVLASMYAALCCIATMVIRIPIIGGSGYINIGDVIVLLSAWKLGGIYGAMAAGVGSAMADILSSYIIYAPATFVIKFFMAYIAWKICKLTKDARKITYIVSAVVAELIMVVGYMLFEWTILKYGMAAFASVPSNGIQGFVCALLSVITIKMINKH